MAANIADENDLDDDDAGVIEDSDSDLTDIIAKAIAKHAQPGDDDDEIFSGPIKEAKVRTVSADEGLDLLDAAKNRRGLERRAAKGGFGRDQEEAPEVEPEAPVVEAAPAPASSTDALLDGLDDDRKATLRGRLEEADAIASVFAPHAEELKQAGFTARDAAARLVQIETYARAEPAAYLAWFAHQANPDDAESILTAAAEKLGLKIVKDEDPFEDDEVKNLRRENAKLKGLGFGPDFKAVTPAPQAQTVAPLDAWKGEKGPDGQLLRPLFDELLPEISTMAKAQAERTGKPVTTDDLARIYAAAQVLTGRTQEKAPVAAPVAAQAAPPVATTSQNKAAQNAAVERAKMASKSIDGTGQGASRRPAPPEGASLREAIAFSLSNRSNE